MTARYEIVFARSARKELKAISSSLAERILNKVEMLASNPRPAGCKKLRGHANLWRLRVGEYRIIYTIDDEKFVVDISVIRHRSEAYR
jgi:mRNA interferase RelE/StbE